MAVIPNSCRECNQHDCVNHQFEWFMKNNPNINNANSVSPNCPLLKEVSQEPRWIPVSEKLPKPFTFVCATCRSLVDDREDWVIETIYLPIPKEVNKLGYSDWGNIPMLNLGEAEVIAWVERIIPQPYKVEVRDKE